MTPDVGPAAAQPLPGGRGLVPLRWCPGLGEGRGHRQDARLVEHAGPRRGRPGPPPLRGARGLQVVRGRPARRLGGLRRRGERRPVLPATGRAALVDRQGRHHRLPAGGGADGPLGPRPGAAATRSSPSASERPSTAASTRAPRRPRRPPWAGSRPPTCPPPSWPGTPSWRASPRRPATGHPSAASRSSPSGAGSRRGHPGTEDVTKLYAESFVDEAHLARIIEEAQAIVEAATADLTRPAPPGRASIVR